MDVLSPRQRSYCMSRNKGRDTAPEIALRRMCWSAGMRYRLRSRLPGKPDLVFPGVRLVVFVDGCFWHGCPEHYVPPATRADFWKAKLEATRRRDTDVDKLLTDDGWRVLRVWEHDIKTVPQRVDVVAAIREALQEQP